MKKYRCFRIEVSLLDMTLNNLIYKNKTYSAKNNYSLFVFKKWNRKFSLVNNYMDLKFKNDMRQKYLRIRAVRFSAIIFEDGFYFRLIQKETCSKLLNITDISSSGSECISFSPKQFLYSVRGLGTSKVLLNIKGLRRFYSIFYCEYIFSFL